MVLSKSYPANVTDNLPATRVLVCGKGGSGKSTVVTLLARVLSSKGYGVLVIDGDASNPGGLSRLLFGNHEGPKPLIEFFGGRDRVECPVDSPDILTRIDDPYPVTEHKLDLLEIPSEYYHDSGGIVLFQVGKIERACEGCDGPMSKISRDFVVEGDWITIIDVEAGIEHYGRGLEKNVDAVIVVADPTFESFLIAEKVVKLSLEMGIEPTGVILNKVESNEMQSIMEAELEKREVSVLGVIRKNSELFDAGLKGIPVKNFTAMREVEKIIKSFKKKLQMNHMVTC